MLFRNEVESLNLRVSSYEFPTDGGEPGTDDRNWLVLRAAYTTPEGDEVRDSNSCLLTYELREMTAGLMVLAAGIRSIYESSFTEPYFALSAQAEEGDRFVFDVAFTLPNSMEGPDVAEVEATLTKQELQDLISELEAAAKKFPDRK